MKILVVEDYAPLRLSIVRMLREAGYPVDESGDGDEGLWMARENDYAVAIVDIMLPGVSGLHILREIRRLKSDTGVLIITARDAVSDRVVGLDAGADDYLVKPFSLDEMMARVRALVRRSQGVRQSVIQVGDLEVDTLSRVARRGGEELGLTSKEFSLLELLALRAGGVVSRGDIWEQLYDFNDEVESNVLDVFIARLRKKIERADAPRLIHTRRGEGYILEERRMDRE